MNFCAICALKTRFVALNSSSLVMVVRTKQHSKPTSRTPSVRREVGGLRGKITAEYNGGAEIPFPLNGKVILQRGTGGRGPPGHLSWSEFHHLIHLNC